MPKECLQQKSVRQTPCFKTAGRKPCISPDCLVAKEEERLTKEGKTITDALRLSLFHEVCRISCLSAPNNAEFWERAGSFVGLHSRHNV